MATSHNNQNKVSAGTNMQYIIVVITLTFIFPAIGFIAEALIKNIAFTIELFGKWFIFSAAGIRLFLAGIRQTTNPAFTAEEIFHINSDEIFPILRELGFANLCFGLVGIISLFQPQWRIVSAFASGLYYGLAALQHFLKKPVGSNEKFALVTDVIIFLILLIYFIKMI